MKKIGTALLLGALCAAVLAGCTGSGQTASTAPESSAAAPSQAAASEAPVSSPAETSSAESDAESESTSSEEETGAPAVVLQLDDHTGNNIGQFPKITGMRNEAIDLINQALGDSMDNYEQHLQSSDGTWMECRAYASSDSKYLNIVTTEITYPTYGTQGAATSYNYDIENASIVTADEAMQASNTTVSQIQAACGDYIARNEKYMQAEDYDISGFILRADGTADFCVRVFVANTEDAPAAAQTSPSNSLYVYHSANQSVTAYRSGSALIPGAEIG